MDSESGQEVRRDDLPRNGSSADSLGESCSSPATMHSVLIVSNFLLIVGPVGDTARSLFFPFAEEGALTGGEEADGLSTAGARGSRDGPTSAGGSSATAAGVGIRSGTGVGSFGIGSTGTAAGSDSSSGSGSTMGAEGVC